MASDRPASPQAARLGQTRCVKFGTSCYWRQTGTGRRGGKRRRQTFPPQAAGAARHARDFLQLDHPPTNPVFSRPTALRRLRRSRLSLTRWSSIRLPALDSWSSTLLFEPQGIIILPTADMYLEGDAGTITSRLAASRSTTASDRPASPQAARLGLTRCVKFCTSCYWRQSVTGSRQMVGSIQVQTTPRTLRVWQVGGTPSLAWHPSP